MHHTDQFVPRPSHEMVMHSIATVLGEFIACYPTALDREMQLKLVYGRLRQVVEASTPKPGLPLA
jgi:hypothetical protein